MFVVLEKLVSSSGQAIIVVTMIVRKLSMNFSVVFSDLEQMGSFEILPNFLTVNYHVLSRSRATLWKTKQTKYDALDRRAR